MTSEPVPGEVKENPRSWYRRLPEPQTRDAVAVIGVICKPNEVAIAEEFFQLFKTPWQHFQDGKQYDVVVATEDRLPRIAPRLLVVYGSQRSDIDSRLDISGCAAAGPAVWEYDGGDLPIYGNGLAFASSSMCVQVVRSQIGITGYFSRADGLQILRLGYDLFYEIRILLSSGQPTQWARVPTLEIHIAILRDGILSAGIPLLEIPPAPAGHRFIVCLTHDIDFVGIKAHKFDHSMWGFLYRSTMGGLRDYARGRIPARRLLRMWWAALLLPFVHLGLAKDYWLPFEWYLRVEKGLPTTYFLVPFKNRRGDNVVGRNPERRATKYDVSDIPDWITTLVAEGCEIGVHGIDAWHGVAHGQNEMTRVAKFAQVAVVGIRMHWLMRDEQTFEVLDEAGYAYDSTAGYNETVGYRCGTTQVFRPLRSRRLLELPLHIQDGALFFPQHLGLDEAEAWQICKGMIGRAENIGGVLTVLWHDRSHGPERFWGDFYIKLLDELRAADTWFATASQVVEWFSRRRGIQFSEVQAPDGGIQIVVSSEEEPIEPGFTLRASLGPIDERRHDSRRFNDTYWTGGAPIVYSDSLNEIGSAAPSPAAGPR
jgi:hypothetical protein